MANEHDSFPNIWTINGHGAYGWIIDLARDEAPELGSMLDAIRARPAGNETLANPPRPPGRYNANPVALVGAFDEYGSAYKPARDDASIGFYGFKRATLIAAAPNLLLACEKLLAGDTDGPRYARAAVAYARSAIIRANEEWLAGDPTRRKQARTGEPLATD